MIMNPVEFLLAAACGVAAAYALLRLRLSPLWAVLLPLAVALAYCVMRFGGLRVDQATTCLIFLVVFAVIVSDRVHKAKMAMLGATAVLVFGLIDQHTALHGDADVIGTDWNTILLLVGMMIIVGITRHTGVFEWIAIKCVKLAKGRPVLILLFLCTGTAVLSAALDNVTTVLLIVPLTILICESLRVDPVVFLICVIMSCNVGGTATLIGDPPNILIGSYARLSFMDFLVINLPAVVVIFAVNMATMCAVFWKRLRVSDEQRRSVMEFDETKAITDPRLLKLCGTVTGLVLLGLCLHGPLGLEVGTIAVAGATILLFVSRKDVENALREVEWPTIFFFIGLFIMVSALVNVGVVRLLGQGIIGAICAGDTSDGLNPQQRTILTLTVCWFSAVASGIVGNVPFTATMNSVIHEMALVLHSSPATASFIEIAHAPDIYPLWWALSLGACLGGNFTLVGASANVVVAGIAERAKRPISFIRFMKYGVPITLQGLLLSSVYLWLRFLR